MAEWKRLSAAVEYGARVPTRSGSAKEPPGYFHP